MPTTKEKPVKKESKITTTEIMKTVSQLTDIISSLQHDVKKIKTRMGI
tara:strand:- start:440 stop:583 length:144 start_codon:yes stop_codon:yes gene_type:complete